MKNIVYHCNAYSYENPKEVPVHYIVQCLQQATGKPLFWTGHFFVMKEHENSASEDLVEMIAEQFGPKNKVKFLISKRGFQRIEISDGKETWQTLEATEKAGDDTNFDEISIAVMNAIFQQMGLK